MRFSISIPGLYVEAESATAEGVELPPRIDEQGFRAFYEETGPALRAYLRRTAGDAALADDILQEAFYRFLRSDLPAMEQLQMKGYLFRVANSLLADHWRRLKRERRWSLERIFHPEASENAQSGGDATRVFRKMKPQEQTLLWLAYVEGFDHREIATALDLGQKSVRVLLFRARKKLAGMLAKESIGPKEGT